MKWFIPLFILVFLSLTGCSGKHCIVVGASHDKTGIEGNIEYCYDFGESKESGVPSFKSGEKKLYAFDIKDIQKLTEKLTEKLAKSVSINSKEEETQIHPIKRLLNLIE